MAIKLIKLQCPNCGASLDIDASLQTCFCQYCGTKILIDRVDEEHILETALNYDLERRRLENEREQKQIARDVTIAKASSDAAEFDAMNARYSYERLKELKDTSKKRTRTRRITALIVSIVTGIFLAIFLKQIMILPTAIVIGLVYMFKIIPSDEYDVIISETGLVRFPQDLGNLREIDYISVIEILEGAGFTYVTHENLHDVKKGVFGYPKTLDKTDHVLINGEKPQKGKLYPKESTVVVVHHGE